MHEGWFLMVSEEDWVEKVRRQLRPLFPEATGRHRLHAAVGVILRSGEEGIEVLLIKRAEAPEDPWSGHIAFPGGRVEPDDATLTDTAIRETREEVGLDLRQGGLLLGWLEPVFPRSPLVPKILIAPLVAVVDRSVTLHNGPEVEHAFWMPLGRMAREGLRETVEKVFGQKSCVWPAYSSPYGPIWGITEKILTQLLSLLEAQQERGHEQN